MERRDFLKTTYLTGLGLGLSSVIGACNKDQGHTLESASLNKLSSKFDNKDLYPVFKDGVYIVKDFSHLLDLDLAIDKATLEHHLGLYKAYVEKVNKSERMMSDNQIDEFSLKNLAFSLNGMALHDIYFHNINTEKSKMSTSMKTAIENTFGSYENYLHNLKETAMQVDGWSITSLNLLNGKVYNYAEDTHSSNFPNFVVPLMALDVYDHAYLNFGKDKAAKSAYIDSYIELIDWDIVSRRYDDVINLA